MPNITVGGKTDEGENVRRTLLLAALAMAALLVFAPAALAQRSNAETPRIENPRNCDEFGGSQARAQQFLENVTPQDEFNLDADNDGIACEELGGGSTATASASASASASVSADPCPDPNFPRETPDGCQASDLPDVSSSTTASPTASASASASSLPETGGPVSVMALASMALLVGSGILAFGVMRRS